MRREGDPCVRAKPVTRAVILALVVAIYVAAASAQPNPALDTRLKALEEELRCLVCQNQSLADSTAPLAEDLRREVRGLAVAGKSDAEIKQYLVARYGDFVLYKPPVKSTTWLLWFGPFALLLGGGVTWWWVVRRRQASGRDTGEPDEGVAIAAGVARARELLDDRGV